MTALFKNYNEWRSAITDLAGLTLDRSYCEERIAALADETIPTTKSFLATYGAEYRDLVVSWFTRASSEA